MQFQFVKGDEVVLRDRPQSGVGVISDTLLAGPEPQYKVWFSTGSQIYAARHLALASTQSNVNGSDPVDLLRRGDFVTAERFRAFMTLAKLEKPLADNLYSFAASRTERLPHQFKAVLKLLASPYSRLLVADEVGLGKTIEAGIILTELAARRPLDHVLVACPSALTEKWRQEMRDRFLLDFEVVDSERFREFVTSEQLGPAPEPRRIIASLELMRRAENLEVLGTAAPRLDVVVVDEAHHMRTPGTATNALGDVLTTLAETTIFLTATPLNLGRADFFHLMQLLVPEEFPQLETFAAVIEPNEHLNGALRHLRASWPPDFSAALSTMTRVETLGLARRFLGNSRYLATKATLQRGAGGDDISREEVVRCQRELVELNTLSHVFTRTRKREVQELFPTRRPTTVSVEFTPSERAFYDAVTDWALAEYKGPAAHLVATTFQRLAASCLPALGQRLAGVVASGRLSIGIDEASELTGDVTDDELPDEVFAGSELALPVEQSAATRLLDAWTGYGGRFDSKYDGFVDALAGSFAEGGDRILVFSYFTGTIDYLADRLSSFSFGGERLRILKLYGPMNADQRQRAVTSFRDDDGPVVLLSSEVGSEGLDFQFCSRMFNYDLPWNPMRVEQRIGRLDRYGQASELIHITNMIVGDTIEERIFYRLYDRIRIFESSIGDLEAILGGIQTALSSLQRDALSGSLTEAELDRRRNLIADVILRRQQDDEAFEQESQKFLSNDDVFLELFNDIERGRRYVRPEELRLLVESYLPVCGCQLSLVPLSGPPGRFRLEGEMEKFGVLLTRQLATTSAGAKAARSFLARLGPTVELTFDPAIATVQRQLEFVSLHHPLIRAVAANVDLRRQLSSAVSLRVDIDGLLDGPHAFFVFELEAHGMKNQLELASVIVNADGDVVPHARNLLSRLDDAEDGDETAPSPDVDGMFRVAMEWVAEEVAQRERGLQARNDEAISAQADSLAITADRRRLWLREQIQEGRSAPIVRMHRAQLERLETDFEARIAHLETKRGVSVGYRLLAAGLLNA